jgi:lipopolysaccharide export system protein LptA
MSRRTEVAALLCIGLGSPSFRARLRSRTGLLGTAAALLLLGATAAPSARRGTVDPTGAGAPTPAASPGSGFFGEMPLGSSKEPIVIDANQLEFDYQKNHVTYRGKVHAVQGDLVIDSDTLIVTLDRADDQKEAKLREVIAQGNVVITQGTRTATGTTAAFSQKDRKIVLMGNPVLRDGPNEVTGDRIVVLLDEGRSLVESSEKKRVTATLYPGSQESPGLVASEGKSKPGTRTP